MQSDVLKESALSLFVCSIIHLDLQQELFLSEISCLSPKLRGISLKSKYCDHCVVLCAIHFALLFLILSLFQLEFLDFKDAMQLFEETGLFYAKPIFRGPLNDALNFPIEFESQIPSQLGLPPLPKGWYIFIGY